MTDGPPLERYEDDWARKRLFAINELLDELDAPKVQSDPDLMDLGMIVLERIQLWDDGRFLAVRDSEVFVLRKAMELLDWVANGQVSMAAAKQVLERLTTECKERQPPSKDETLWSLGAS